MTSAQRIGIYGGTFDPPHVGHLVAAVNVAHQLRLTSVLFMVANIPWQKVGTRTISSADHRLAMTRLAVSGRPGFEASDLEIRLGGDSVTADTLEALASERSDAEFAVIVGSDAAEGMHTWRRAGDLARLARVAVVDRPGTVGGRPPDEFRYDVVPCPLMDLSSTELRARSAQDLPIEYLVPDAVGEYIAWHRLYRP